MSEGTHSTTACAAATATAAPDLERAKVRHLSAAMARIEAAAYGRPDETEVGYGVGDWHPHRCGGFCYECHFASAVPVDLDRHERDSGHHAFGALGTAARRQPADAGHVHLAVPLGLTLLAVLWLLAGMALSIGGIR